MKQLAQFGYLILLLIFATACGDDGVTAGGNVNVSPEWSIPSNEVRDGGPGKDGIPSVDNPNFSSISAIDFLNGQDLVIAIETGDGVKAYPHPVLDWHEIANDELASGKSLALTYCPLTGTAIGWNKNVAGQNTTFGVSGLLYNSNLIPYDRATDSNWSQMSHKCVNGPLIGTEIETFHVIEMSFNTLREMYPDAQVMNSNTGFNRDYTRYPYGDYRTNNSSLIFPVNNSDNRVANKERVLGVVVNEQVLTYRFDAFVDNEINVVQNSFQGKDLVVVGSQTKNFISAYENRLADGTVLTFEAVQGQSSVVMRDNEGNEWDIFGKAVAGPRTGEALPEVLNYIGYWFSWAAFNATLEIYEG